MALPVSEWLPLAKRLAVGQTARVRHRLERRPNMVVGHDQGHFWAYCQACKEGGRQDKEHVRLGVQEPVRSRELTVPQDLQKVQADPQLVAVVGGFLARKHMDFAYLPDLWYSKERMRLLLNTSAGWFGRDLTERSGAKWLSYTKAPYALLTSGEAPTAIITEDLFSAYKVRWAMRNSHVDVYAGLGTRMHDKLLLRLAWHKESAFTLYDGDAAGDAGASTDVPRLRGVGLRSKRLRPPDGLDPKDMTIDQLRELIGGALSTH